MATLDTTGDSYQIETNSRTASVIFNISGTYSGVFLVQKSADSSGFSWETVDRFEADSATISKVYELHRPSEAGVKFRVLAIIVTSGSATVAFTINNLSDTITTTLTSDDVVNNSTVSGATVSDALAAAAEASSGTSLITVPYPDQSWLSSTAAVAAEQLYLAEAKTRGAFGLLNLTPQTEVSDGGTMSVGTVDTGAYAAKGMIYDLMEPIVLSNVRVGIHNASSTGTYKLGIYQLDNNTYEIDAVVWESDDYSTASDAVVDFSVPSVKVPCGPTAVLLVRTDGTATDICRIGTGSTNTDMTGMTLTTNAGWADNAPAASDTIVASSTNDYRIELTYVPIVTAKQAYYGLRWYQADYDPLGSNTSAAAKNFNSRIFRCIFNGVRSKQSSNSDKCTVVHGSEEYCLAESYSPSGHASGDGLRGTYEGALALVFTNTRFRVHATGVTAFNKFQVYDGGWTDLAGVTPNGTSCINYDSAAVSRGTGAYDASPLTDSNGNWLQHYVFFDVRNCPQLVIEGQLELWGGNLKLLAMMGSSGGDNASFGKSGASRGRFGYIRMRYCDIGFLCPQEPEPIAKMTDTFTGVSIEKLDFDGNRCFAVEANMIDGMRINSFHINNKYSNRFGRNANVSFGSGFMNMNGSSGWAEVFNVMRQCSMKIDHAYLRANYSNNCYAFFNVGRESMLEISFDLDASNDTSSGYIIVSDDVKNGNGSGETTITPGYGVIHARAGFKTSATSTTDIVGLKCAVASTARDIDVRAVEGSTGVGVLSGTATTNDRILVVTPSGDKGLMRVKSGVVIPRTTQVSVPLVDYKKTFESSTVGAALYSGYESSAAMSPKEAWIDGNVVLYIQSNGDTTGAIRIYAVDPTGVNADEPLSDAISTTSDGDVVVSIYAWSTLSTAMQDLDIIRIVPKISTAPSTAPALGGGTAVFEYQMAA